MRRSPARIAAATLAVAAALGWAARSALGLAFVDGPPLGVTGGFGEVSCHQCHFDQDPNAPGGSVTIRGLPAVFEPGERYDLTVTIARKGLKAGGFQLAARYSDGEASGRTAGKFLSTGPRARIARAAAREAEYAQHTKAGTEPTSEGEASWKIEWIAPREGAVTFHVASVAADADVSPFGDFVYTREQRVQARAR